MEIKVNVMDKPYIVLQSVRRIGTDEITANVKIPADESPDELLMALTIMQGKKLYVSQETEQDDTPAPTEEPTTIREMLDRGSDLINAGLEIHQKAYERIDKEAKEQEEAGENIETSDEDPCDYCKRTGTIPEDCGDEKCPRSPEHPCYGCKVETATCTESSCEKHAQYSPPADSDDGGE
jgi:hypothetical protein